MPTNALINFTRYGLLALAISQPAFAITLEQAWQAAKTADPTYMQAQIQSQISQTDVATATIVLRPSLNITAQTSWNQDGDNQRGYGATLSQTLWDSSAWSALDQSQAHYVAAQLRAKAEYNNLAARLLTAYLELASAQGDLTLAQEKWREGAQLLHVTEQRYLAGKIRATELEDMRANHVDEQAALLAAQSALASKQYALTALINQPVDKINEINTQVSEQPTLPFATEQQWIKLAKDNSPTLLASIQELTAAQFAHDAAKAKYYPTLSGSVSYQSTDQGRDGDLNAGLTLSVPIDLNGATRSSVDRAQLTILNNKQAVRKVEIDIQQEIQTRFHQLQLEWQRIEIAQQQVLARQTALESKQAVYNAGMTEASEVITAHNALFNSKHTLQTRLYDYWYHRIALLKTVGKLDDENIALIARVLQ
ncbi:TolC family protein [Vibrio metschnikovii]|uniref:TolC family protein n=1 Tax=bacterium 19MO02SH05 TaxID=2920696 RepID=A0AAU6TM82_UNCXX|nr:TolC family protein [Vibrio metschnikovii]EKO3643051.1 TolC family protein [Vibrio metschnikovii]EKO3666437.1 TolC family protein [Vibrio metschnikovii]EKO3734301.1 TolC family protein [Vibrio metschnikovii]EKO3745503.1 TolC family protein [Vibrio metschnikovii]